MITRSLAESLVTCGGEYVSNDGKIIIKKVDIKKQKHKNIKELFADFTGGYQPEEIDWGKPTGREIW